ncbi:MAG: signal peptidase II [Clostridia bacterium]|nr:signal peptidase II [Clostridia bacterium]
MPKNFGINKKTVKSIALYAVLFAAMLAIDLITKLMVIKYFRVGISVSIIDGILDFTYVRNPGAAFGIFKDNTVWLAVLSVVILIGIAAAMIKFKPNGELVKMAVCMISAGAVGNLIDRIRLGYVVDFIDVNFFNFPVFNVADCFVCIGALMLALYMLLAKE